MAPKQILREAISYRRVSTDDQGRSGIGLQEQLVAINTYAEKSGYQIVGEYHDVGSGRGPNNLTRRPGIQKAIKEAQRRNVPLIVDGLDRASREVKSIEEIVGKHKVKIISTNVDDPTSPVVVSSQAARAQLHGESISRTTRDALAKAKARGVKLGNPTNLPEAQKKGTEALQRIAKERAEQIADVLRSLPGRPPISDLVEILNDQGIFTSRGHLWTVPALRRPLAAAEALLRAEKEAEAVEVSPSENSLGAEDAYRNHPLFGRF